MIRLSPLFPVVLALAASPLAAQNTTAVFERVHGDWQGAGTLMGRPARFTLRWDVAGGFAVLTFSNAFADSSGRVTPVLQAAAAYRTSAARPEAVWLDSRGVRFDITWEASDSALVSSWTGPSESGRTTYRVGSAGDLEVVDEVRTSSGWRTFATARYQRTGAAVRP